MPRSRKSDPAGTAEEAEEVTATGETGVSNGRDSLDKVWGSPELKKERGKLRAGITKTKKQIDQLLDRKVPEEEVKELRQKLQDLLDDFQKKLSTLADGDQYWAKLMFEVKPTLDRVDKYVVREENTDNNEDDDNGKDKDSEIVVVRKPREIDTNPTLYNEEEQAAYEKVADEHEAALFEARQGISHILEEKGSRTGVKIKLGNYRQMMQRYQEFIESWKEGMGDIDQANIEKLWVDENRFFENTVTRVQDYLDSRTGETPSVVSSQASTPSEAERKLRERLGVRQSPMKRRASEGLPEDLRERRKRDLSEARRKQLAEDETFARQLQEEQLKERKMAEQMKQQQDKIKLLQKSKSGSVANTQDLHSDEEYEERDPFKIPMVPAKVKTAAFVNKFASQVNVDEDEWWTSELGLSAPVETYRSSASTEFLGDFDGEDESKWPSWIAMFRGLVHKTPKSRMEKLLILQSKLKGKAKALVRKLSVRDEHYGMALGLLVKEYGGGQDDQCLLLQELRELKKVKEQDADMFITFANTVRGNLAVLEPQGEVNVRELINNLADKLPYEDRKDWKKEELSQHKGKPTLEDFSDFLMMTTHALKGLRKPNKEAQKDAKSDRNDRYKKSDKPRGGDRDKGSPKLSRAKTFSADSQDNCAACKKSKHLLQNCPVFKDLMIDKRYELIRTLKACFGCLQPGHRVNAEECSMRDKLCNIASCDLPHHPLLHYERRTGKKKVTESNTGAAASGADATSTNKASSNSAVTGKCAALGLVDVLVHATGKRKIKATVFLDPGSNKSYISESFRKKIGVRPGTSHTMTVSGFAGVESEMKTSLVKLKLEPLQKGLDVVQVSAWTVPQLTKAMEVVDWSQEKATFEHLADLPLMRIESNIEPDILLGTDNNDVLLPMEVRRGRKGEPSGELSGLGWIVRGPVPEGGKAMSHASITMLCCHADFSLPRHVEQFLGNEVYGTEFKATKTFSQEEQDVWRDIKDGIVKLPNEPGYQVALPWRKDLPEPLDNRHRAEKTLESTLRRLDKKPGDRVRYEKAVHKYINDGYARIVYKYDPATPPGADGRAEPGQAFQPHQGVLKKDGETMRLVFNAAAEAKDGLSLNDHLHNGPKLQSELPAVFTRMREEDVAYTADVEAMFSRIRLSEKDAKKHRWLWKFPEDKGLVTVLEMTRVVFGDGPSPCLAIATLQRTAQDFGAGHPEATDIIMNGMYVDDVLDSAATVEEANQRAHDLTKILENGDFHLRGWYSNHPEFEKMKDEEEKEWVKVLGTPWHLPTDTISHAVPSEKELGGPITKRGLLSLVASIFSPLGLSSPFILKAKVRIGRLHAMGLSWDENLEEKVKAATSEKARAAYQGEVDFWKQWKDLVPAMCEVRFPRCIRPGKSLIAISELHMFGDASEEAFAAAVYLRHIYKNGEVKLSLVLAKTRVAPKKVISVAKLELSAALLGVRLVQTVESALRFPVNRRVFWTDSAVTRHWIKATATFYKPFVACRVGEIQTLTNPEEWRHVPGKKNVADVATRSAITEEDAADPIPEKWIKGPEFLYETDERLWPKDLDFEHVSEEVRPSWEFMTLHARVTFHDGLMNLEQVSNYLVAKRALARVLAWRKRGQGMREPDQELMRAAEILLLKDAQKEFSEEMKCLLAKKAARSSRLVALAPFLDEEGLIRVGGRLGKSQLPFDAQHPIILGPKHRLTVLLAEYYHRVHLHGGHAHVLGQMRQKFWVINGRSLLKKISGECFKCRLQNARRVTQLMADLPPERTVPCPAFGRTSVDYFGPLTIRVSRNTTESRWVALFACMVTRAVHLELAASYSAADFLVAYRTFVNIRGEPRYLYSDNGTNFVGAKKILLAKGSELMWKFYPPAAPHFGGLHERLVRSAKVALRKATEMAMRRRHFTESELRGLLAEVMGFLNSRPLTYLSEDPTDQILTPNHFLLQRPGPAIPAGALEATKYKDNYQFVQSTANDVWKIWQAEFLPALMTRAKWQNRERNLAVDDVVLLVEDNVKRGHWDIGRIVAVYPDSKGYVRSVRIRVRGEPNVTEYDRPAVRCCLLEKAPELPKDGETDVNPRVPLTGDNNGAGEQAAQVQTGHAGRRLRRTRKDRH